VATNTHTQTSRQRTGAPRCATPADEGEFGPPERDTGELDELKVLCMPSSDTAALTATTISTPTATAHASASKSARPLATPTTASGNLRQADDPLSLCVDPLQLGDEPGAPHNQLMLYESLYQAESAAGVCVVSAHHGGEADPSILPVIVQYQLIALVDHLLCGLQFLLFPSILRTHTRSNTSDPHEHAGVGVNVFVCWFGVSLSRTLCVCVCVCSSVSELPCE
jgi:hypothetical protein